MTDTDRFIDLQGVGVSFPKTDGGRQEVLRAVDLTFGYGDFVALVGRSGCGKTTLLNTVAGITDHTGTVSIDGTVVDQPQPDTTGYMFAKDNLLPWRTVVHNVALGLQIRGDNKRQRELKATELLAQVGLAGHEHKYPWQLSHGMRQRAALARTLAVDPKVLLMDEPFGALDAQTRIDMQDLFLRVWDDREMTVILVTHDISEAIALAGRVLVMVADPGRIVLDEQVALPRPRNLDTLWGDERFRDLHTEISRLIRDPGAEPTRPGRPEPAGRRN